MLHVSCRALVMTLLAEEAIYYGHINGTRYQDASDFCPT